MHTNLLHSSVPTDTLILGLAHEDRPLARGGIANPGRLPSGGYKH